MSTLCIAVMVLAAPPTTGYAPVAIVSPSAAPAERPWVPPRTGTELRDAVRESLRRWARPDDKQADLAAREFLVLYRELQRDGRLARTQREPLRVKVRSRLLALSRQISKRVAIEKRLAKQKRPKSVAAVASGNRVLGQWGGFGQPGAVGGGGPGGNFGNPGTANNDYGQQLVELIQQTIAPASWDVNGGPGTIYYWRPGRALVIRQTQHVHDDLGGVLRQLRRAGQ